MHVFFFAIPTHPVLQRKVHEFLRSRPAALLLCPLPIKTFLVKKRHSTSLLNLNIMPGQLRPLQEEGQLQCLLDQGTTDRPEVLLRLRRHGQVVGAQGQDAVDRVGRSGNNIADFKII